MALRARLAMSLAPSWLCSCYEETSFLNAVPCTMCSTLLLFPWTETLVTASPNKSFLFGNFLSDNYHSNDKKKKERGMLLSCRVKKEMGKGTLNNFIVIE